MRTDALRTEASATLATVARFNDAFNRHDVDAIMDAMTDDCVCENTSPPPDGERYAGSAAVRSFWEEMFRNSPDAAFSTEDAFAAGDRCAIRWRYTYSTADGTPGHIRGVDMFRVRDGKVAEKLAYVKG